MSPYLSKSKSRASSESGETYGSKFRVKDIGVKSIRMPGLFLVLAILILVCEFQAHFVFENNKQFLPKPRAVIRQIIDNTTLFREQEQHFAAIMYDEEHLWQRIESESTGHNGGVGITLLTLLITALLATFNLASFSQPGQKLVADSVPQTITTCVQATFTETGSVGISALIQILVLIINEIGVIRLISLDVFMTETTVRDIMINVHWGLQYYALTFLGTLIILVWGSFTFQKAWRQANYIRLNAPGKIADDMSFLRAHPNLNPLLFWKKFRHGNPFINNRRLTYWTMEHLANRFINQLKEYDAAENHFDFAEYLCQRCTKIWVRLAAVRQMSAFVILCAVILLRPYLHFQLKVKLMILPCIGFVVLIQSKMIMTGWQTQLRRLLIDPERIRDEIRRQFREDRALLEATSFRAAVKIRLKNFKRHFTGYGKERLTFLTETMNTLMMLFVFWVTMVMYELPDILKFAWPLLIPIIMMYVVFVYIMDTMVYFCVLCMSVENQKDLPLVQAVKTQQTANDAFQAMYLCHGLVQHVNDGFSKSVSKPLIITDEDRAKLAMKEHRQINLVAKMVMADDSSKRDASDPPEEVSRSKLPPRWFTVVEEDGSRFVSIEDLCKCFAQFQLELQPTRVAFVFPELAGKITEQKLSDMLTLVILSQMEADIDELTSKMCDAVWDMLDVQSDGDIDLYGFIQQFTAMVREAHDHSVSELDAEDKMLLLNSLDGSGDGTIDADEFKSWLASFIGKYRYKYDINT